MQTRCQVCQEKVRLTAQQSSKGTFRCPWCGERQSLDQEDGPRQPRWLIPVAAGVAGLLLLLVPCVVLMILFREPAAPVAQPVQHVVVSASPQTTPALARAPEQGAPGGQREGVATQPFRGSGSGALARTVPLPPGVVEFMGIQAKGKRVCLIADASASMRSRNRIDLLKRETELTLRDLTTDMQFYVYFFSTQPEPMPAPTWLAGGSDVDRVLPWVKARQPLGGTRPLPAFQQAFALRPAPDLIYFLTDGSIPSDVPSEVARLNQGLPSRVRINTILLGGNPIPPAVKERMSKGGIKNVPLRPNSGEALLRQIAEQSGGEYRLVEDEPQQKR